MGKDPFTAWKHEADAALRRGWVIGLEDAGVSDEELRTHFDDGEAAVRFAEWFADKYDLIDFPDVQLPLHRGYT